MGFILTSLPMAVGFAVVFWIVRTGPGMHPRVRLRGKFFIEKMRMAKIKLCATKYIYIYLIRLIVESIFYDIYTNMPLTW